MEQLEDKNKVNIFALFKIVSDNLLDKIQGCCVQTANWGFLSGQGEFNITHQNNSLWQILLNLLIRVNTEDSPARGSLLSILLARDGF